MESLRFEHDTIIEMLFRCHNNYEFIVKGIEENSHLHRINTSTTYISTRRKQQISGKPLHKTEVCN